MLSSIFSSRSAGAPSSRWIAEVALCAIGLLAAYAAAIQLWLPPVDVGQSQGASNRIKIERYLYRGDAPAEGVIIGSSLSARLPPEALGSGLANLALGGDSALTGLEIVARHPPFPKILLVEINVLQKPANHPLVASALAPVPAKIRELLPAARVQYQPINILYWALHRVVHGRRGVVDTVIPEETHRTLLALQDANYRQTPDAADLSANLEQLRILVRSLETKGVTVVFFELPVDPSLVNLPLATVIRHHVQTIFPVSQYCWIDWPIDGGFRNTDGVHLIETSAYNVAATFEARLNACSKGK